MVSKNDCILLLSSLKNEENKKEIDSLLNSVIKKNQITLDTLQYINSQRPLEVKQFYEYIRNSYNKKKSPLYKNIVRETEDTYTILTTLSAMATQILLYSKKLTENVNMFLDNSRLSEIYAVLYNYSKYFDILQCKKLLSVIRADIKVFEQLQ